uniref:Uncharacterized protein n=1 Tax=Strigamia maritima TaxID=126957 RepID=T1J9C5_STRMM
MNKLYSKKKKERKHDYSKTRVRSESKSKMQFLEKFTKDFKSVGLVEWFTFWIKVWLKFSVPMAFAQKNTSENDGCKPFSAPAAENVITTLRNYINKVSECYPHHYFFLQMLQNLLNKVLMQTQHGFAGMPKKENQKNINNWLMEKFHSTLKRLEQLFVGTVNKLLPKSESNGFQYLKVIN